MAIKKVKNTEEVRYCKKCGKTLLEDEKNFCEACQGNRAEKTKKVIQKITATATVALTVVKAAPKVAKVIIKK